MSQAQIADIPSNRMQKRRLRTRLQLLEAVEKLMMDRGYEDTSAEAIAEKADLGRSTFYNHFDNKESAVLATLTAHYERYGVEAYVPLEENSDRAISMAQSTGRVFTDMAKDPLTQQLIGRPRLLVKAIADSQSDLLAKDLTAGIQQDRFSFVCGLESLTTALAWTYVGLLIEAITKDAVEEICRDWVSLVLLNLGVGREEIEGIVAQVRP